MNPVNVINLYSAKLLPTRAPSGTIPDLFDVRIEFEDGSGFTRFSRVYVPFVLQSYFETKDVSEIHVDTLDESGLASSLLPGKPTHILVSLITKNAEYINMTPPVLEKTKRWITLIAGLLCVVGLYQLWSQPIALAACLSFTSGVILWRSSKNIPTGP